MKKFGCLLTSVALLLALTACGNPAEDGTTTTTTADFTTTNAVVTTTTAAASDETTTTRNTVTTTTTRKTTTTTKAVEAVEINGKKWKPTFVDEFDGDELDIYKWAHCPNWVRDDCVWTNDHAYVDGEGHLVLRASADTYPYKAGAIRSKYLFEQAYGYFEVRCKLTPIAGINPAFWLMCDSAGSVGIPGGTDGAEIDIIEAHAFDREVVQHALHWDGYEEAHGTANKELYIPGIYEGFHTFALEWNADEYIFYIDGEETWRTSAGGVCATRVYLKLTLGIGGWTGPINALELPVDAMVVDYVRVYEAA